MDTCARSRSAKERDSEKNGRGVTAFPPMSKQLLRVTHETTVQKNHVQMVTRKRGSYVKSPRNIPAPQGDEWVERDCPEVPEPSRSTKVTADSGLRAAGVRPLARKDLGRRPGHVYMAVIRPVYFKVSPSKVNSNTALRDAKELSSDADRGSPCAAGQGLV